MRYIIEVPEGTTSDELTNALAAHLPDAEVRVTEQPCTDDLSNTGVRQVRAIFHDRRKTIVDAMRYLTGLGYTEIEALALAQDIRDHMRL